LPRRFAPVPSPREFRAQRLPFLVVACIDKREPVVAKIDDRCAHESVLHNAREATHLPPSGISPLPMKVVRQRPAD
jgi:hypothetical protein